MKFFQKVKTITSKQGEVHFERWAIVEFSRFAVYIHKIHKADKDKHLHSHPWNFWGIVLSGSYVEQFAQEKPSYEDWLWDNALFENAELFRVKKPGSFSSASRDFFHKIAKIHNGPVTTLFITWGKAQPWFYSVDGQKVESEQYRTNKHNGLYD